MKKLVSLLLCVALLCSTGAAYYSDIQDPELNKIAETLNVTGIIDGLGDGTFNPGGYLTREQFAKITVCILGDRDRAAASMAATAFTDVMPDSWARGYISYVAEKGIISGFPDGSFGGAQVMTYAQAATVLLRCMGYTDAEIGFHWPSDYVDKAAALGLNQGLSLSANDPITRADAAVLIYNALFTELNGGGADLISKTGITVYKDAVLYGANPGDSSVTETSEGSFKVARGAIGIADGAGKRGDLFVNKDKELILFRDNGRKSREIVVTACLRNVAKNTVDVSYDGGTLSIPYSGTVYYDGARTTAINAADNITIGSTMNIYYDDDGRYSAAVLSSYVMEGPYTVTGDYTQVYSLFDIGREPTVIRRGVAAGIESISRFDVVYYSAANNTVYAYTDKVSGIYERAYPLKSSVTRVTVSGKEYELASPTAMSKLNESKGAFAIGDYITLLLDRDGKVADAIDASASNINDLGVLLNTYSRINDNGTQEQIVKLFLADGTTMEYVSSEKYKDLKGELVRISFRNGYVSLSRVKAVSRGGKIDKENRTFDGLWLTSDCSVLVLADNPDSGDAVVRKIRFSDIDGSQLLPSQVIHAEIIGSMNDVVLLYLKNVTKTDYDYGLITKIEYSSRSDGYKTTSGEYHLLINGEEVTIYTGRRVFTSEVVGVNTLSSEIFVDAVNVGSGKRIEAAEIDRIKVDGTVYKTAPDFDIYKKNGIGKYTLISTEDAMAFKSERVTLYADTRLTDGGLVRVAVIE